MIDGRGRSSAGRPGTAAPPTYPDGGPECKNGLATGVLRWTAATEAPTSSGGWPADPRSVPAHAPLSKRPDGREWPSWRSSSKDRTTGSPSRAYGARRRGGPGLVAAPPARLPRGGDAHPHGPLRPAGTEASRSGPQRTVLAATPTGKPLTRWPKTPVEHVRDGRSLLMLKLLFLSRGVTTPLCSPPSATCSPRMLRASRARPTRPRGSSARSRSGGTRDDDRGPRGSWRPCSPSRCRAPTRRARPPSSDPPRASRLGAVPDFQECRR